MIVAQRELLASGANFVSDTVLRYSADTRSLIEPFGSMNLEDSYRILGINASSSEEKRFKAYEELRGRLNAKLSNAPTSGLKEKYRKTLLQLDEAIEAAEASFDEKEMPIFKIAASAPASRRTEEEVGSNDSTKRAKPSRLLWIVSGVMIIVVLLVASSIAWQRHVESEAQRVAAIELARAEEVKKEELALVQQELEPLKRPYELFSRKLEATLENAEIRNGELETALGVAKREGSREEQEVATYRLETHSEYLGWLRGYLDEYSVAEILKSVGELVSAGRVSEATRALTEPVTDFESLSATIEETKQRKYELPLKEFVANQEYNRALDASKKALGRLDFANAIATLEPYKNREYVGKKAKSELESIYALKHEDVLKRTEHATEIGELQLARTLLDTLEGDPISSNAKQRQIDLVEQLNSEYALEEAILVSRKALERNAFAQARVQLAYLVKDAHVGERAQAEIEKIDTLEKAWQDEQDAIRLEVELAKLKESSLNREDGGSGISEFDQPPQLLSKSDPVYPDLLRRSGTSGYVELEWEVGVDGRAKSINVLSSSRYEYEIPAVEAVRRWRFKPAEKNGVSVAAKVRQKLLFNPR